MVYSDKITYIMLVKVWPIKGGDQCFSSLFLHVGVFWVARKVRFFILCRAITWILAVGGVGFFIATLTLVMFFRWTFCAMRRFWEKTTHWSLSLWLGGEQKWVPPPTHTHAVDFLCHIMEDLAKWAHPSSVQMLAFVRWWNESAEVCSFDMMEIQSESSLPLQTPFHAEVCDTVENWSESVPSPIAYWSCLIQWKTQVSPLKLNYLSPPHLCSYAEGCDNKSNNDNGHFYGAWYLAKSGAQCAIQINWL